MPKKLRCPHCGNKNLELIRYTEEQLINAEYALVTQKDGSIAADLSNWISKVWDGEVTRTKLSCKQCHQSFRNPGIRTVC